MPNLLNTAFPGYEVGGSQARAGLIIVHGLAEHADRYREIAAVLAARGIAVFVYDQRGHGNAAGPRTHIARFDDFVDDLASLGDAISSWRPSLPLYVWGHSMGAVVSTLLADRKPGWLQGVITSSHSLEVFAKSPDPTNAFFRMAARVVPRLRVPLGLDVAKISSVHDVQRAYSNDPRIPKTASLRLFVEFGLACKRCRTVARQLRIPWLVLHGGEDAIAPVRGAQKLFDMLASRDKQLQIYAGARHEVHNEKATDREAFLQLIGDWIAQHMSADEPTIAMARPQF